MERTEYTKVKQAHDAINKALYLIERGFWRDDCESERICDAYDELINAEMTLNELV